MTSSPFAKTSLYALTVFFGAFLLFQIQPLIGKFILPWFGGGPEVWTTCMLLFQVLLLAGYVYAHLTVFHLSGRVQAALHIMLILAALVALPITPGPEWKPQNLDHPIAGILLLITFCIGLPYFVLSATGPLLQGWFSRTFPDVSPYRLYALSNAGSLLALLSYPFIFEPFLTRHGQAWIWTVGFFLFAFFCISAALILWKNAPAKLACHNTPPQSQTPSYPRKWLWLLLPATASVELLAVTNKICQDVAALPFLWILPLSLYLLSFIICFHSEKWYHRSWWIVLFLLSLLAVALVHLYEKDITAPQLIFLYSAVLFFCCMICHGELFRLRPDPKHLTPYYLMIATGGALGGFFVAIAAPLIFDSYREFQLGFLACFLFILLTEKNAAFRGKFRQRLGIGILMLFPLMMFLPAYHGDENKRALSNFRNFFGVLIVWENDSADPAQHRYVLQHGTTFHGLQFTDPAKHLLPTAYYGLNSGIGRLFRHFPSSHPRRIGAIGLGVGTIAYYVDKNDSICFYEINPQVKQIAQNQFTYLSNCPGRVNIVMGDARLTMEKQSSQQFDLLVLDAFSSDSVPIHLLTSEAFAIYLKHLKDDGALAFHVSSRLLDVHSVVWKLAEHFQLHHAWIKDQENKDQGIFASDWIILTRNDKLFRLPKFQKVISPPRTDYKHIDLWTDEHVNLFQILK